VEPCIPTLTAKPPAGPGWVHEIKHDGYRLIVRRDGKAVHLFTRRGYDWTERYPAIAATAGKLRAKSFTLDGEGAVSDAAGIAVFEALHRRRVAPEAILHAFDLLELNGKDLRPLPLSGRKAKLARLPAGSTAGIVYNEHTDEDGAIVFRHACRFGSKRKGLWVGGRKHLPAAVLVSIGCSVAFNAAPRLDGVRSSSGLGAGTPRSCALPRTNPGNEPQ
jgi:bifunctional non-homologous end joining protein LigD